MTWCYLEAQVLMGALARDEPGQNRESGWSSGKGSFYFNSKGDGVKAPPPTGRNEAMTDTIQHGEV